MRVGAWLSLSAFAFCALMAHATHASAQEPDPRLAPRLALRADGGVAGSISADASGADSTNIGLAPSLGGQLGFELPLHGLFSLGLEVGARIWHTSGAPQWGEDPNVQLDASLVPRVRIPWGAPGFDSHGAAYVGVPVGASFAWLSGELPRALELPASSQVDPGGGFHVGAIVGVQYFPIRPFGFVFEIGYIHHFMWHGLEMADVPELRWTGGQLRLRAGVIVAF